MSNPPHDQPSLTAATRRRALFRFLGGHRPRRASSLVTALLVVVVLSTIVVAFMQTMSVERAVAKSAANRLRAELAVEAGIRAFLQATKNVFTNDNFIVVANGTYTFAGRTDVSPGQIAYTPLFSAKTNAAELSSNVTLDAHILPALAPEPAAAPSPFSILRQVGFAGENATMSWVDIPGVGLRFSYWARDLASQINAQTAGNTNSSGLHQRATGTNVNEIPLFTLFVPNTHSDPGNTPASQIIANRSHFLSPSTPRQVLGNFTQARNHLTAGGGEDIAPERIPFGMNYPSSLEGQPKRNLNSFVSPPDVNGLANFILQAIPAFANRAGGFTSYNYTRTIAANIIDYADNDTLPTGGNSSLFWGFDSYPLVNEWFDLHNATWPTAPAANGTYMVQVHVRSFVEFWNMTNQTINGTVHFIPDWSNQRVNVNGQLRNLNEPTDTFSPMAVSIPPNGFLVREMGNKTYTFPWGPTPPPSNANMPMPRPDPPINFRLLWNGVLVDRAFAGVNRANASTGISRTGGNVNHWRGSASPPNNRAIGQTGDPRMNKFLNFTWVNHTYSGSDGRTSWGGRNHLPGLPQFEIRPSYWPQPQHDSAPGTTSPNSSTWPTAVTYPSNEPEKAVAFISNQGGFRSATELRFVFDPAMWEIITNATPPPRSDVGGGIHLAIGRPDFPRFLTSNASAARLLDIFSARTARPTKGLVNLNTASPEALRSLVLGIDHSLDTALLPVSLRGTNMGPPTVRTGGDPATPGESFVKAIEAARPLRALSQLAEITYNGTAFFGNPSQYTNPPTSWNHAAATHLFSRIADLVTFQSRNFEVFVVGQALDKNGKVLATARKSYLVFYKPERNATGSITNMIPQILYSSELP